MIFDMHSNLKYRYGNRKFWAEGYYVSTLGLNESTIRKYIREQCKCQSKYVKKIQNKNVHFIHLPFGKNL